MTDTQRIALECTSEGIRFHQLADELACRARIAAALDAHGREVRGRLVALLADTRYLGPLADMKEINRRCSAAAPKPPAAEPVAEAYLVIGAEARRPFLERSDAESYAGEWGIVKPLFLAPSPTGEAD